MKRWRSFGRQRTGSGSRTARASFYAGGSVVIEASATRRRSRRSLKAARGAREPWWRACSPGLSVLDAAAIKCAGGSIGRILFLLCTTPSPAVAAYVIALRCSSAGSVADTSPAATSTRAGRKHSGVSWRPLPDPGASGDRPTERNCCPVNLWCFRSVHSATLQMPRDRKLPTMTGRRKKNRMKPWANCFSRAVP